MEHWLSSVMRRDPGGSQLSGSGGDARAPGAGSKSRGLGAGGSEGPSVAWILAGVQSRCGQSGKEGRAWEGSGAGCREPGG